MYVRTQPQILNSPLILQHYFARKKTNSSQDQRCQQQATTVNSEIHLRGDRSGALPITDRYLLPSWQRES